MRLKLIEPTNSTGTLRAIFEKLVMVPNVLCMMANSAESLDSYSRFHENQGTYKLSEKLRKVISLAVSEYNSCAYCVALHTSTAITNNILTENECLKARMMEASNKATHQLLKFVKEILDNKGRISDKTLEITKASGFDDQQIVEVISIISFITMANLAANVGQPELDFLEPERI